MTAPILHVVYAGRGDAFYLEYTDTANTRKLVCLDGGPNTKASSKKRAPAPYWKFYISAGKKIWRDSMNLPDLTTAPFRPHAYINKNPHRDHIEGLLGLLQNFEDAAAREEAHY